MAEASIGGTLWSFGPVGIYRLPGLVGIVTLWGEASASYRHGQLTVRWER